MGPFAILLCSFAALFTSGIMLGTAMIYREGGSGPWSLFLLCGCALFASSCALLYNSLELSRKERMEEGEIILPTPLIFVAEWIAGMVGMIVFTILGSYRVLTLDTAGELDVKRVALAFLPYLLAAACSLVIDHARKHFLIKNA